MLQAVVFSDKIVSSANPTECSSKTENQDIVLQNSGHCSSSLNMILLWRQFSVTELGGENVQRSAKLLSRQN